MKLNDTILAFVADERVKCFEGVFTGATSNGQRYTFKTHLNVEVDDFVVVETAKGMSVVKVVAVDVEPEIDGDSKYSYRWGFQKVENSTLDKLLASEGELVKEIKKKQLNHFRSQVKAQLGMISAETPTLNLPAA